MGVVVLIGFSCVGKNWLKDKVVETYPEQARNWDVIDTDKVLPTGKHEKLRDIFSDPELVHGGIRDKALRYIEDRERTILNSLRPTKPTLVVAGPGIPSRQAEWDQFIAAVEPKCFLLKVAVELIEQRLVARQDDDRSQDGSMRNFGSWNESILTVYDSTSDQWVNLSEHRRHERVVELYNYNYRNVYNRKLAKLVELDRLMDYQLRELVKYIKDYVDM